MSAADHFAQRRAQQDNIADEEQVLDTDSLYDSERLAINQVTTTLMENIGKHRELGSFQREVRERFAEIGFIARCDFYESRHEDHLPKDERTQYPEITLVGRCDPMQVGDFDHDKMGHEVRSNIIGNKDQDNVQKTQVAPGWSQSGSGLIVPN